MDRTRCINSFFHVYIGSHHRFQGLDPERYWVYIHSPDFQKLFKETYGCTVGDVLACEEKAGRIPPSPTPRRTRGGIHIYQHQSEKKKQEKEDAKFWDDLMYFIKDDFL